ncbi:MAG TPA: dUTP diphosphatase [Firmicutes bacterium]|jgi:dUTP pyrophosphatase|nr:dUTP diphosphatase [Bacillota bacterium]HAA34799.1 dUTP diphosphatase [Bacillota bacterium]
MTERTSVLIKKMPHAEDLPLPRYASELASGIDLFAALEESVEIKPGEYKLIPTGIALAMPPGYEGQIRPRSGLALNHGITILNSPGTIDADYRGEIKVILINLSNETYMVQRGERIAQLVIHALARVELKLVDELPPSNRGAGGFGHTGKF